MLAAGLYFTLVRLAAKGLKKRKCLVRFVLYLVLTSWYIEEQASVGMVTSDTFGLPSTPITLYRIRKLLNHQNDWLSITKRERRQTKTETERERDTERETQRERDR